MMSARDCYADFVIRVTPRSPWTFEFSPPQPYDEASFGGQVQVLEAGFDPTGSPLGRPVEWKIIRRRSQVYYLSTFLLDRDEDGAGPLACPCMFQSGRQKARVTLETLVPEGGNGASDGARHGVGSV